MANEKEIVEIIVTIFILLPVLACMVCGTWCTIANNNVANSINNLSEWTIIDSGKPIILKNSECYPTQDKIIINKTELNDRIVWTPNTKWDGHSDFKLSNMNPNKHYSLYTHKVPFAPWVYTPDYLLVVCED
jgi:hypothetical protein